MTYATPRLHLKKITPVQDDAHSLFKLFSAAAEKALQSVSFGPEHLWALAQFLDLADAGYACSDDVLVMRARSQARAYLQLHGGLSDVQRQCVRSAALQVLDAVRMETLQPKTTRYNQALLAA